MSKNLRIATGRSAAAAALLALSLAAASSAHAQVTLADIGKNIEKTQTDSSGTLVGDNAFFYARAFFQPNAFDGGSVTVNGGTSYAFNGPSFDCCGHLTGDQYQTPFLPKATMDANFPTQSTYSTPYQMSLTNSANPLVDTAFNLDLPDDFYTANDPTFSAADFTAMTSLTAGQGLTLNTDGFTPGAGADGGTSFLSVFDLTANQYIYSNFGSSGGAAWTIGAGSFTAGHSYETQLIYDSYINLNEVVPATARADLRTDVFFSLPGAAVPEPAAWALMLAGFGVMGANLRRRRALAA
ncbi:MAG: PEPxxWA-CTERM sorting domain-containing protein [Phenylobacterium sp.]